VNIQKLRPPVVEVSIKERNGLKNYRLIVDLHLGFRSDIEELVDDESS
jgi:hypothetical protein